jgi:hypothetical protein
MYFWATNLEKDVIAFVAIELPRSNVDATAVIEVLVRIIVGE